MKIKGATDNLATIGEPVSEQDQVMNLLGGLGVHYNAVITAINIKDDRISLEVVHSMLLAFEYHLEQQSSIDNTSIMSANYASSSNNRGSGKTFNGGHGQGSTQSNNSYNYYNRHRGREDINEQGRRGLVQMINLSAIYVLNLATLFKSIIIALIFHFKVVRTMLLLLQILVIKELCLLWLIHLTTLQMRIGILTQKQSII